MKTIIALSLAGLMAVSTVGALAQAQAPSRAGAQAQAPGRGGAALPGGRGGRGGTPARGAPGGAPPGGGGRSASPEQLANVVITRDIVYGHKAGMALTYDVIRPRNANGTAVVNMISGSWYSTWAPPENRVAGYQALLEKGITVIAMHHGSSPQFKVPEAAADIQRGMRHVKLNAASYGVNPARIGAWGASAGGHLALVAGIMADDGDAAATDPVLKQGNRIKAVVAYFPPSDMRMMVAARGFTPALDYEPELAPTVSPVLFADASDPPTLIIHGDADRTVNITHGRVMHEALDKVGVENVFTIFPGADHGFRHEDPATTTRYSNEARTAMVDWFVKHL